MNSARTVQAQQTMYATAMTRVPAPATVTISRFAPPPAESIHKARDGHWAVYICVAVLCLAVTIYLSSFEAQVMLDQLIQ